jgi:zinc D-Ala-D-Ala carboxypeptidase
LKRKRNNNAPKSWLLAALAILLAVLFIFSRGERAARRAKLHAPPQIEALQTSLKTETQEDMEPQIPEITEPITLELLLGKVDPASDPQFVAVETKYANRPGMFMHKEAYEAFVKMHEAARADGVNLVVVSAMRTFNHQRRIWNDKWNGRQILEGNISATTISDPVERAREVLRFSAMPGTSRHHWGTDIDLNSLVNSYFESGQGKRVHNWLQQNAASFGFCQPYTAHGNNRQGGYEEEKWHWSYKPVSKKYLRAFKESVGYEHITGFDGWETASQIGVIERYILDVNGDCKN